GNPTYVLRRGSVSGGGLQAWRQQLHSEAGGFQPVPGDGQAVGTVLVGCEPVTTVQCFLPTVTKARSMTSITQKWKGFREIDQSVPTRLRVLILEDNKRDARSEERRVGKEWRRWW